jgi:hypothetical protein
MSARWPSRAQRAARALEVEQCGGVSAWIRGAAKSLHLNLAAADKRRRAAVNAVADAYKMPRPYPPDDVQ